MLRNSASSEVRSGPSQDSDSDVSSWRRSSATSPSGPGPAHRRSSTTSSPRTGCSRRAVEYADRVFYARLSEGQGRIERASDKLVHLIEETSLGPGGLNDYTCGWRSGSARAGSNLMDAEAVASDQGGCTVRVGDFPLRAGCGELTANGTVKVVARPERVTLLEHGAQRENCLPGMVERTVYVGASLQVIVRLATGASIQASVTNTGEADVRTQGTPVAVHIPADALRVLAPAAGAPADGAQPASPTAETASAAH